MRGSLLNKGDGAAKAISVRATSPNPGVLIQRGTLSFPLLAAGRRATLSGEIALTVKDLNREIVKLVFEVKEGMGRSATIPVEIPVFPDSGIVTGIQVADGGRLPVWERTIQNAERTVGAGNGDAAANPGETIALAWRDGDAYRLAELFANDACVDMRERVSDMWGAYDNVGASAKVSLPLITSSCPEGHEIVFFARFQLPNKPEHILKQGWIRVRVAGRDRTPPHVVWNGVSDWNRVEADIRDGGRVASAEAALRNDSVVLRFPLNDEGLNGDAAASDGVFTGLAPNPPPGRFTLSVSAADEFGNAGEVSGPREIDFAAPGLTRRR